MYIAVIVEGEVKLILAKLQDAPDYKAATMHDVMESWLAQGKQYPIMEVGRIWQWRGVRSSAG